MNTVTIILLVILVILTGILIALYFTGKRLQKKQAENQAQIEAMKQPATILVIDKKKMKLKDSGLPEAVTSQANFLMRRQKMPMVKAKVGPQIVTLLCDQNIYDQIPLKTNVRAMISGIYIVEVHSVKGGKPLLKPEKKKKGKFGQMVEKLQEKAGAKPF